MSDLVCYHPQTNGLCEKFNSNLIQMLAKVGERHDQDRNKHLPYVLYAYIISVRESTKESPLFLLYGPRYPCTVDLDERLSLQDYRISSNAYRGYNKFQAPGSSEY